jgi:hypothetical protein
MKFNEFGIARRAAAVLAASAGVIALSATTALAAGPSATVSPASGLASGQTVTVSGSGFPGGATIGAVECNTFTDPATASCEVTDATTTAADAGGNFSLQLKVVSSFSGVNPANGGQPAGQVDCAAGCTVYVGTDTGISVPVAISFQ